MSLKTLSTPPGTPGGARDQKQESESADPVSGHLGQLSLRGRGGGIAGSHRPERVRTGNPSSRPPAGWACLTRFFSYLVESSLESMGLSQPHFMEQIKAQRGEVTCPRAHSQQARELGGEAGGVAPKPAPRTPTPPGSAPGPKSGLSPEKTWGPLGLTGHPGPLAPILWVPCGQVPPARTPAPPESGGRDPA